MLIRSRRLKRLAAAPLAAAACLLLLGAGIRAEDLACEHAASVLDECCPDLSAAELDCSYDDYAGCSESVSPPIIGEAESQCVRDASCAQIVEWGVCDRIVIRQAERRAAELESEEVVIIGELEEEPVCP